MSSNISGSATSHYQISPIGIWGNPLQDVQETERAEFTKQEDCLICNEKVAETTAEDLAKHESSSSKVKANHVHFFHRACINQWLIASTNSLQKCPTCFEIISPVKPGVEDEKSKRERIALNINSGVYFRYLQPVWEREGTWAQAAFGAISEPDTSEEDDQLLRNDLISIAEYIKTNTLFKTVKGDDVLLFPYFEDIFAADRQRGENRWGSFEIMRPRSLGIFLARVVGMVAILKGDPQLKELYDQLVSKLKDPASEKARADRIPLGNETRGKIKSNSLLITYLERFLGASPAVLAKVIENALGLGLLDEEKTTFLEKLGKDLQELPLELQIKLTSDPQYRKLQLEFEERMETMQNMLRRNADKWSEEVEKKKTFSARMTAGLTLLCKPISDIFERIIPDFTPDTHPYEGLI